MMRVDAAPTEPHDRAGNELRRVDAIVIGASAGAVEALSQILPALPASLR
ncbi:MAG: hypothetical protein JWN04_3097, partial [Myxococcaceae bacterium]|nr:hypothetical protein [Myxococcaceae bacterium]